MHIHELFLQRARQIPEVTALSCNETTRTYAQCAAQVECLAQGLAERLLPGSRIAINMYKSIDTIVMMLACLRAGCTYVPIDPTSPLERRLFILHDSEAQALVIDTRTAVDWGTELQALTSLRLVIGPHVAEPMVKQYITMQALAVDTPQTKRAPVIDEDQLAYILYTSGSTGVPKGVMITHRNAAAFVEWGIVYFDVQQGDRVAVHAPLHFDLPVFDIYVSLAQGATVFPLDEKTVLFPQAVVRFLREKCITILYAVPSALTALVNRSTLLTDGGLPSLRLLLYAGEEFHPAPLRKMMTALQHTRFFNLYGPIETNVVTVCEVKIDYLQLPHIPIGKPIFNARILLQDTAGQIIEDAQVEGEILVSGLCVTPGYLKRPELTAASHTQVHYQERVWSCYRTGDFARWDERGMLHFLGRRDSLIKTRGFRVDLGDVEATLMTCPGVAEVGVIARPHPEYTNLLYAFVVPQQGTLLQESALLAWSREKLTPYMVPHHILLCEQLPKTSTGKIARKALAEMYALETR